LFSIAPVRGAKIEDKFSPKVEHLFELRTQYALLIPNARRKFTTETRRQVAANTEKTV